MNKIALFNLIISPYLVERINKLNELTQKKNSEFNFIALVGNKKIKSRKGWDYFEKLNSDIPKNISLLEEVTIILSKIKNIYEQNKINIIYEPLYKPSQHILKLQFNITQDEVKDMYLKYIENGIHIGKEHIYDKYGRCILSNIKKSDIEKQSYSLQDYKRLQVSIQSGNTLINKTEESNDTIFSLIEQSEMKKIDELIENIPNLDVLKYLKNFLIKIKESETDIFDGFNTTAKPQTYRKTEKFDIYKPRTPTLSISSSEGNLNGFN